jgi:hypothetical protein
MSFRDLTNKESIAKDEHPRLFGGDTSIVASPVGDKLEAYPTVKEWKLSLLSHKLEAYATVKGWKPRFLNSRLEAYLPKTSGKLISNKFSPKVSS